MKADASPQTTNRLDLKSSLLTTSPPHFQKTHEVAYKHYHKIILC